MIEEVAPLAVADRHEGDTVLDLGSGGGLDMLLSAPHPGATAATACSAGSPLDRSPPATSTPESSNTASTSHPIADDVVVIDLRSNGGKRTQVHIYSTWSREDVMAWIEKPGEHSWRVRYLRDDGHSRYGSVSGFTSESRPELRRRPGI